MTLNAVTRCIFGDTKKSCKNVYNDEIVLSITVKSKNKCKHYSQCLKNSKKKTFIESVLKNIYS